MSSFLPAVPYLEILLLLYVAMTDVTARLIPNSICLLLAALAMVRFASGDLQQLVASVCGTASLFVLLLILFGREYIGGGDVKLLTVLAIGLPISNLIQFLTVTVLAGGMLAMVHLMMRHLPYPALPPVGSSRVRRVYAIERWRNLREAPLPFAVAIACGGIWIVLSRGV